MGKKKTSKQENYSLTSPLLEFEFEDPLFAIAAHPERPLLAIGLANGYIFMVEYNNEALAKFYQRPVQSGAASGSASTGGTSANESKQWVVYKICKESASNEFVKVVWKTKRHKGSIRSMCFNATGDEMYSVGSDNVIKRASTLSGKVIAKTTIKSKVLQTKILKSQTHPIIVTGDESGNVRVFDEQLEQTNIIQNVHEDSINSIVQLIFKSAYQFLSIGSTTVSVWDCRKEQVKLTSENQEDEILSCAFLDQSTGETLVCGMGEGILTIWKPLKNDFSDQISRVKLSKNESVDCVISTLQDDDCVWAGTSDGLLHKVDCKNGKVVEKRVHSIVDEVGFLDMDCEYRLISGGLESLVLWNADDEIEPSEADGASEGASSEEELDDSDGSQEDFKGFSDDEADQQEQKAEEEEVVQPNTKKPKKGKVEKKSVFEHGIRKFDDL